MDSEQIVAILLAIFLPPLAVYLKEQRLSATFWIDVVLTICAWFPGMLFALYIVLAQN
ncbi:YqaE/Pmp3 family membrane protein [Kocuria palustris]|nr:YqaE/Pmp3 family membrane protein [Kocuria palustris]